MTNEEFIKLNKKEILKIMEYLKNSALFNPKKRLIIYSIENFYTAKRKNNPLKEDEIMHILAVWGAIKIHSGDEIIRKIKNGNTVGGFKELCLFIIQPNFDDLHKYIKTSKSLIDKFDTDIASIKLPKAIELSDIEIEIRSEDFDVFIKDKKIYTKNYIDIGCYDRKTKDKIPDKIWSFFKTLAVGNGEYDLNQHDYCDKRRGQFKSKKKILSDRLKAFFQINEDVFYAYKNTGGKYKLKFKIKEKFLPKSEVYGLIDNQYNYVEKEYIKQTTDKKLKKKQYLPE